MHLVATPVAEPKRSARNVRPAEVTPGSPPRKRARIAPTPVEAATPARTPRVKLVLGGSSHKKKVAPTPVVVEEGPPDPRTLPFGGRLTDEDADTTTCKPAAVDRALFKRARVQAEKIIASSLANSSNSSSSLDLVTSPTRTTEDHEHDTEFYAPAVPKIKSIYFGTREISTWYSAPYPEEYNGQPHIYICEYCFKYMKSEYVAGRHQAKCPLRHPPGDEIYRDGTVSVFEVDGRKNKIYCQNLCLLAKMFLDHKTLYYDVEPFLFYILTENDENGCHFVGYFSKEKRSSANYNLSCIVTLPVSQRKGYGGLLIEFSYLLSRKEGRTGSPEKPLSDLGLVTYRRYWRRTVLRALDGLEDDESVSIEQLSAKTCMTADDIIHTLHLMNMLQRNAQGDHVLVVPRRIVREQVEKARGNAPTGATVNPGLLRWTPLLFKPVMQQPPVVDAQERDEERDEGAVEVPEVGDGDGEAEAETVDV
ncbi:hypothetical protein HKX48_007137 [Thoreauomyces humboldtii]|nr:hypothetical protein HKX48_007137 [Thoreauomyces humboldtii]